MVQPYFVLSDPTTGAIYMYFNTIVMDGDTYLAENTANGSGGESLRVESSPQEPPPNRVSPEVLEVGVWTTDWSGTS